MTGVGAQSCHPFILSIALGARAQDIEFSYTKKAGYCWEYETMSASYKDLNTKDLSAERESLPLRHRPFWRDRVLSRIAHEGFSILPVAASCQAILISSRHARRLTPANAPLICPDKSERLRRWLTIFHPHTPL